MKRSTIALALCAAFHLVACGDDDSAPDSAVLDAAADDAPIIDVGIVDTRPEDGAVSADCRAVCAHAIGVCPDFAEMEACVISCMEGIDQGTLDCINASTDCDSANACLM